MIYFVGNGDGGIRTYFMDDHNYNYYYNNPNNNSN